MESQQDQTSEEAGVVEIIGKLPHPVPGQDKTGTLTPFGRRIVQLPNITHAFAAFIMHSAINAADADTVTRLITEYRIDPNISMVGLNVTPLHRVIAAGHCSSKYRTMILTTLLKAGADPKIRFPALGNRSALSVVTGYGNPEWVRILCKYGADVNTIEFKTGYTALHRMAARNVSFATAEIIKTLVDYGAQIDAVNGRGKTALIRRVNSPSYCAIGAETLSLLPAALMLIKETDSETLSRAVRHANVEAVNCLLEHGADCNVGSYLDKPSGIIYTTLGIAAALSLVNVAKTLLHKGANIDGKGEGSDGVTALVGAMGNRDLELAKLLIAQGADPNIKQRFLPLNLAAGFGDLDQVRFLMDAGAELHAKTFDGYTALRTAVYYGQAAVVGFLLSRGAKIEHHMHPDGWTMLGRAIHCRQAGIARLLVEAGANVNAMSFLAPSFLVTPLYCAARRGLDSTINLLASKGAADIDGVYRMGHTAVWAAIMGGHVSTVALLLDLGARLFRKLLDGSQPLVVATQYPEMLKCLLGAGFDVNHRGKGGDTVLHHAAARGHFASAKILLQAGAKSYYATDFYVDILERKVMMQGDPAAAARKRGHAQVAALIENWEITYNGRGWIDLMKQT